MQSFVIAATAALCQNSFICVLFTRGQIPIQLPTGALVELEVILTCAFIAKEVTLGDDIADLFNIITGTHRWTTLNARGA